MLETNREVEKIKKLVVLFGDPFRYRHAQFRVKSASRCIAYQQHCYTAGEMLDKLTRDYFDVVFLPAHFDDNLANKIPIIAITEFLIELPEAVRPRLVIFHGSEDVHNIIPKLLEAGYLATHIPWDSHLTNKD